MKIYVVAFGPSRYAHSGNAVGGVDWFYDKELALRQVEVHLTTERAFPSNSLDYVFYPVELPERVLREVKPGTKEAQALIQEYIEESLELP